MLVNPLCRVFGSYPKSQRSQNEKGAQKDDARIAKARRGPCRNTVMLGAIRTSSPASPCTTTVWHILVLAFFSTGWLESLCSRCCSWFSIIIDRNRLLHEMNRRCVDESCREPSSTNCLCVSNKTANHARYPCTDSKI